MTEPDIKKLMLQELKEQSRLIGNSVTIKPMQGNIDEVLALKDSKKVVSTEVKDDTK